VELRVSALWGALSGSRIMWLFRRAHQMWGTVGLLWSNSYSTNIYTHIYLPCKSLKSYSSAIWCDMHAVISVCYWSNVSDAFVTPFSSRVRSEMRGVELVQMAALGCSRACTDHAWLVPVGKWVRIGVTHAELECAVPRCVACPLISVNMRLNDVSPFWYVADCLLLFWR